MILINNATDPFFILKLYKTAECLYKPYTESFILKHIKEE